MTDKNFGAIIGTAGHIDHGKTTLVKALTGRDMDTLDEEIRRGITISPGFTWLDTEGGVRAGLIDVPGHERFIKNMIAGAVGIDYAMLVVAANDGVKPQTREHLWILETLGIKSGIVALTKCSLADELMIELACDDIESALKGTFLEGAEIIRVDSLNGMGIKELKSKLEAAVGKGVKGSASPEPRLNIDRVFTKKGFGPVVTGTLAEGTINVGDDLFLYPQNIACKARGIQIHESASDKVWAGCRAAINLSGVKAGDIKRGDILAGGEMKGSDIIDVKLRLFPKASRKVEFWDRLRLYIGTREVFCRAVPLSGKELLPGEEDFCQFRLEDSLYCKKEDRFVVRTYSPMETVGGGIVIDPNPPKHSRMNEALLEALSVKERGEAGDIMADYIKSRPGALAKEIISYAALSHEKGLETLRGLEEDGIILKLADAYFHWDYADNIREKVISALDSFHKTNPLKKGMPKEELKSRILTQSSGGSSHIKAKSLEALFEVLEKEEIIKITAGVAALYAFKIHLSDKQQAVKDEILSALLKGGFSPPGLGELNLDKKAQEILLLLSPEYVMFLDKSTIIHREYYNKAKELLADYFEGNSEITLAAFRDMLGTSRKYAQLILENFDDARVTVRVGDVRKLRK